MFYHIQENWYTIVDMKELNILLTTTFLLFLTACSNNPDDPLEPFNRAMYSFNDTLDHYIAEPIAKGYNYITPAEARSMITNFFNNLTEPLRAANDLLQLKFTKAFDDMERMIANSTFGVFGLFDFADDVLSIPMRKQDMGMTLAYWTNNSPSTFIMIPFAGPSTLKNTLGGIITSISTSNLNYGNDIVFGSESKFLMRINRFTILNSINKRAQNLKYEQLMHLQLDPYIAVRQSYINSRNQLYRELNT